MESENYFFDVADHPENDNVFVLIIYDIADNKKRLKLSKLLAGYGFRIQKSAFEAVIGRKKYKELLERLPAYVTLEDSIRVYKITGRGQVTCYGRQTQDENEDIIVI